MYVGSEAFQTANARKVQRHKVFGTVGDDAFDESNILAGSLTITRQICDSSDFKLGGVFISTLRITFLKNFIVTADTWRDRDIFITIQLRVTDIPEAYEGFQMGVFTVASANSVADGIEVVAYDYMAKFDKLIPDGYQPNGKPYTILQQICSRCGVAFGNTSLEIEALPNGNTTIALWPENDCRSYRDVLFWIAQTLGGYCTIDTTGHLILNSYKNIMEDGDPVPELPFDYRCSGGKISDYKTAWRGIYIKDMQTGENNYVGLSTPGPIFDCGANPFVQYGTAGTLATMSHNIFESIAVHLRPFDMSIMSMPIWFPGDPIKLTGGIATGYDQKTIVHYVEWNSANGTKIQCFGANPRLNGTKANASANAASKSTSMNGITYKRYYNTDLINVGSSEAKVCDIYFSAEKDTDIDVTHEILLSSVLAEGKTSMTVDAVYYLDGVELTRRPIETYTDSARHILTLNHSLGVDQGNHRWEVYLTCANGNVSIPSEYALSILKGQGLTKGDAWNGVLILADEISYVPSVIPFFDLSENVDVTVYDPAKISGTESIGYYQLDNVFVSQTDSVVITMGYREDICFCGENYYMGTEGVLL